MTLRLPPASAWLAVLLLCCAACRAEDPAVIEPVSIRLLIWSPDRIQGPITARIPPFTKKTGIRVDVHAVPELSDVFAISQSPIHDVDVTIGLNVWVGDFVNSGFIEPLDGFIERDRAAGDPELSWDTIPPGVQLKNLWGGRTYSMICDNDNMFLIYRKDVLSNPNHQNAFFTEKGYALPNPPKTIEEMVDVATYFDAKDWDGDGTSERGFVMSRTVGQLMYWYALGLTTPYTVMPAAVNESHGLPNGLFLFKPDMTPLVNTPGFKQGIQNWLTLARLATPTAVRQTTIDQMVRGEALMAIDWGDTGPAALAPNSEARGKLGFALPPGTRSYFDWTRNQMVPTQEVHYAPLHQANGFAFYMTSTSAHKEEVWQFIKYMNSPEVSMGIVSDPRGGYQPWRTTHTQVERWVEAGWGVDDARNYVDAILNSVNHENASLDLRIPGIFDYGSVLESHLDRLLAALEPNVDAEMEACAAAMQAITTANQPEAQRAAYRAHLGLQQ